MKHLRPSFFIIGVNKCGTSSLYRYLVAHPCVLPCAKKEPNFFGQHDPQQVASRIDEYYALFPTREYRGNLSFVWEAADQAGTPALTTVDVERKPGADYITGEASANTFHDVSPSLLHQYLPEVKLILLIRNPVERAYSHHRMYRRFQAEGNDLGFEVRDFETDILAEMEAHARGAKTHYISPGIYIDKLREWVSVYGRDRIKVLLNEELARPVKAQLIMRDIEDYLALPRHDYGDLLARRFNHAPPSEITPSLRARLAEFYSPYNQRLQEFLEYELPWN